MCGYCHEEAALDLLTQVECTPLSPGDHFGAFEWLVYMRETPDYLGAFFHHKWSVNRRKIVEINTLDKDVAVFRALEILLHEGAKSTPYRNLIVEPAFKRAIQMACSDDVREDFDKMTAAIDISPLAVLYDSATYLDQGIGLRQSPLRPLMVASVNLMQHYISWWLKNANDRKREREELDKMAEFADWLAGNEDDASKSSVEEPVNAPPKLLDGDSQRFTVLARALYFAIQLLGKHRAGIPLLRQVAKNAPRTPDFIGHDLWLQRVAALKLYDLVGFDAFVANFADFRAIFFEYIDLLRGFSHEQKRQLHDLARRNQRDSRIGDIMRAFAADVGGAP
ncbi:MAG: hypothetical protein FPO08_08150 [Geobacter sp.]|nr:MAG: hypothetical protein FPO08_08150 [Geobacter sp.]